MTARPCLGCGALIDKGNRCGPCTPRDPDRDTTSAHWNTTRWKNLSARLRKASPFCEVCGKRGPSGLHCDHILPIRDYPELTYTEENLRILCQRCNTSRGATYTHEEALHVLSRLQTAYKRRPKVRLKNAIKVAQRAIQGGEGPPADPDPRCLGRRGERYSMHVHTSGGGDAA